MGDDNGAISNVCQVVQLGITIAVVVLIAKIYNATGENPLEIYDRALSIQNQNNIAINGLANYLDEADYVSTLSKSKYCQCGEKILNNICTEEQIVSGCYDVSKSIDGPLLRNLDSIDCSSYNTQIISNGFSRVFDLGFEMVNKMALGILIVLCCVLASVALTLIAAVGSLCCGEGAALIIAPCALCIICVCLFAGLVNFILFIILMVNYYKGTTTGEFLDYYNSCMNSQEQAVFKKIFEELDSLDSNMTAFVTLNFIQMALSCISNGYGAANKKEGES